MRFSIDDWMNTLFWPDCPQKNDLPWAMARVRRCERQVATVAGELIHSGVSSVLDMGLTTRAQREGWRLWAEAAGIAVELHSLELSADLRWSRVQERNNTAGDTFVFSVTRQMFDSMEGMWDSPTEEEGANYRVFHRITASDTDIMTTSS